MKIAIILGTRPEIIKLSSIIRECENRNLEYIIIHTNQHYSDNMDKIFFEELSIRQPNYNLNIRESLHGKMTGRMLIEIEKVLILENPDWVLVQGDTNTVLAGALAAAKLNIRVGHVEAGLRSYDRSMPEELNRVVVDHLSDLLFAPTKKQAKILLNEGISERKIVVTGNTIVDAVFQSLKISESKHSKNSYQYKYILLTLHRPSNVDNKDKLEEIIFSLESLVGEFGYKIIFPIHPRTRESIKKYKIKIDNEKIEVIDPVGYLEMLKMEKNAELIITDSGGIQEEACILKIPCVTLRNTTERPETVDVGASMLSSSDKKSLSDAVGKMLKKKNDWKNPFGDGMAGSRIADNLFELE